MQLYKNYNYSHYYLLSLLVLTLLKKSQLLRL